MESPVVEVESPAPQEEPEQVAEEEDEEVEEVIVVEEEEEEEEEQPKPAKKPFVPIFPEDIVAKNTGWAQRQIE